jgi:hypothetical protein
MSESNDNLKVINPDKFTDDDFQIDPGPSILPVYSGNKMSIRNMLYDEEVWFQEANSQDNKDLERDSDDELYRKILEKNLKNVCPPEPPTNEMILTNEMISDKIRVKIGDGKFQYISNLDDRNMLINAWLAITLTNNWDFIAEDIESFMWSNDPRINDILRKMEELGYHGHSGSSFGFVMRNMQYLIQNGENKFIELFEKPYDDNDYNDDVFLDVDPELHPYEHEDVMEYEQRLKEVVNRELNKQKRID